MLWLLERTCHAGTRLLIRENSFPESSIHNKGSMLSGLKILVVDDEPDVLTITTFILMQHHAEVIAASTPQEGLEQVKRHRPDVIVSDIGMPLMDGYQFMRAVRKLSLHEGGNTPAIAVTAFNRPEDRTRALEAGFQGHLFKPVDMHGLIATIVCAARRELHA
jgi:CheY-like chemotaxis protein